MSGDPAVLLESLRERGVVPADAPPLREDGHERPWFIALMQGMAGWLAGVFLLVFIGMAFRPSAAASIVMVGLVLLGAAWAIYRGDQEAVFLDQLALALSIAGQCAVAWALLKDDPSVTQVFATLLLLQLVVFLVMPNRAARTLAALFASLAWVYLVRALFRPGNWEMLLGDFGQPVSPPLGAWTFPAAWLVTWLPLLFLLRHLLRREAAWMASNLRDWARPLLTGVLIATACAGMASEPLVSLGFGFAGLGLQLSWWAIFPLLSIALAAYAAWVAFQLRSHGLLGLAIAAALMHLAHFYYLYGTTLLVKSLLMLFVGVGMLAVGELVRRREEPAP